jgi:hypothetical protein
MIKQKQYLVVALFLLASFLLPAFASAAQLTQAGVRLGRLSPSATTGNDVLVTFKLNTTPTSVAKISISFPSGFTLTAGTPTPVTTGFPNTPASIAVPPGTLTSVVTSSGAGAGGTIVVSGLTSASLNNTSLYGFIIPSGSVQNPSTGATQYNLSVASQNSGGTPIDTTTTPVYITTSSPADQVTVNASVAANFSFSLSANSDTVPPADPSAVQTSSGVTMTVGTNSALGYTAFVKSANGALTSATSPGTPINSGTFNGSPDALTPLGTISKYTFVPSTGTACTTCTGSITYDAEYNGITGTTGGSFNGTSFASFVSRNGYTNADAIILKERVAVTNTIGAANDYTDTLTIIAAGNF